MIPVKETSPGVFERIVGNPVLLSLDGEEKAPLAVLLHESWSDKDRARFGVALAEPFVPPVGKRIVGDQSFEKRDGKVVEVRVVEDKPKEMELTPAEKVARMLSAHGLTLSELRDVLGGISNELRSRMDAEPVKREGLCTLRSGQLGSMASR